MTAGFQRLTNLCLVIAVGCGPADPTKTDDMHQEKKFDFLAADVATRELYARHHDDPPDMLATLRAALRTDARPSVRQNAVVALSASTDPTVLDDFIFALDDRESGVVSEAGFTIAARLTDVTLPDQARWRALAALSAHAVALRAAFESARERVRFNALMALEATGDRELDLAKPLADEGSLIRGEGLKLAAARAGGQRRLAIGDVDALVAFVHRNTDVQLHDDAVDLLAQYAPERVGPVILRAIADDSVTALDLRHAVELRLAGVVPAIVSYLTSHPDHWNTGHLDTLVAFHAVCAAPVLAELFSAQTDKVLVSFLRDALRTMSGRPNASDATLVAWAKQQSAADAPCR